MINLCQQEFGSIVTTEGSTDTCIRITCVTIITSKLVYEHINPIQDHLGVRLIRYKVNLDACIWVDRAASTK